MISFIKRATIFALIIVSMPVLAAKTDLLMLLPGFPGTTAQAQPYVDKMLRYLEKDLKLKSGTMKGLFISDASKAQKKLEAVKPGIALMGASVYAQNSKTSNITVIAKLYANGQKEQKYYIVTGKKGAGNLADLKGKAISGQLANDGRFIQNVIFDKKGPANLTFKFQKRALKSLRDVAKGKVDAAIIDDVTKEHMKTLDFAKELKIIFTSKPVPVPVVVVLNSAKKDAAKIKKSLTTICNTKEGKALCKSLTISSIIPAANSDYKALLKKYNR